MEKLIKLLNEYCKEKKYDTVWYEKGGLLKFEPTKRLTQGVISGIIISKQYGFIKWLVDNDKIDRLTFCTVETPSAKYEDFDLGPETPREDYTNILLMDLAIQEKPIEFLISILRER